MKRNFTIGEISRLFGIGADSIRYYEELGAIQPKRGENGYRYYRVEDIWRMNVIRDLRSLGFSMPRITEYLQGRSVQSTLALLEEEQSAIEAELARLQRQKENVAGRIQTIRGAQTRPEGQVCREEYPDRWCHEIPEGYASDEEMDVLIQRLLRRDPSHLYIIGNNRIGSRLNMGAARQGRCREYDSVFIIGEGGDVLIPGGRYLSLTYRGSCDQNARYVPMLLDHAAQNGLTPEGAVLELLLMDIHVAEDMGEHTTELQLRYSGD